MKILDTSNVSLQAAQAWARKRNSHERFVNVAPLYWQIAPRYGIPPEILYAQAGHETGWGKYSGVVPPEYNNWCGLKTTQGGSNDAPQAHMRFPDAATGVLAHVQHLARYAGLQTLPEGDALVDPRWHLVTKFTHEVEGLGGAWAPSRTYGNQIASLAADLRSFANDGTWNVAAQIPGFAWLPADSRHHTKGRTKRISGFAVHYTAGTDSRGWLTTNPNSDVSATFLIRHNPTLDDRGWQLVRIEDTPHTTGGIVNPMTVSFEYEHTGSGTIPDAAYDVMAQTILDTAAYVKAHGLGEIPLTRAAIKGHKEWVGDNRICPDGIEVDRIVRRIQELIKPDPPTDDWPKVPVTERDPWRADNPWGKDKWIPRVFVDAIRAEGFMTTGYVLSEAFAEADKVVQYFERARWELSKSGEVTKGLVGLEALICKYPERKR